MIILLTLIVIGLSKLLWWLKDFFKRESFIGETNELSSNEEDILNNKPPPEDKIPINTPIPSNDDILRGAFLELPLDLQEQTLATPIVETPQIEAEYERDMHESEQRMKETESAFRQSVQGSFVIDPTIPIENQLQGEGKPVSGEVSAPTEPSPAEEAEFQTLVRTLQTTALDQCFQSQCAPLQASADEACRGFAEQCYYRLDRDISKCLKNLDGRCNTVAVEGCRATCQQKANTARNRLNQGEILEANHRLSSPSGSTHLLLRDTGHLELYYRGRLLWTTASRNPSVQGTMNQGPYTLLVDPTGSLVIKNGLQMTTWATNTWLDPLKAGSIHAPYQLIMEEQHAVLLNNEGATLWDSQNAT